MIVDWLTEDDRASLSPLALMGVVGVQRAVSDLGLRRLVRKSCGAAGVRGTMTMHPPKFLVGLLCLSGVACASRSHVAPPVLPRAGTTATGSPAPRSTAVTPGPSSATSSPRATSRRAVGALDVNGDGFGDVVLSETGDADHILVHLGHADLVSEPASQNIALTSLSSSDQLRDLLHPGDINGDGFSDIVVVTNSGAGVLLGGADGLAPQLSSVVVNPDGEVNGVQFLAAGDINGDGFADLLGSVRCTPMVLESFPPRRIDCATDQHHWYVWNGSADGLVANPSFEDHTPREDVGELLATGDVDGDGFDDVLRIHGKRLALQRGSARGLRADAESPLVGPRGKRFDVAAVARLGDINGDGFGDVVAFAYGSMGDANRALVYLGSSSGLPSSPSQVLRPPHEHYFHLGLLSATALGDVDGDGFGDVAVGDFDKIAVYRGSKDGLENKPSWSLAEPKGAHNFGTAVGPGDIDGDGFADLWSAAPASASPTGGDYIGHAYVYRGGPDGLAAAPAETLVGGAGRLGDYAMWFATGSPR